MTILPYAFLIAFVGLAVAPARPQVPDPQQEPILSSAVPSPAPPAGPWSRARHVVPLTDTPPAIDGAVDDAAWWTALHASGFHRALTGAPIPNQTEAWVTADGEYLYIAFHCLDSEPHLIRAEQTQRGGALWNDDYVGIDIDSQNTRQGFSSFLVSAGGVQWEYREGGTADNVTWSGDWRSGVRRTPDGWTAEMAIPFRGLRYGAGSDAFGLLLYRRIGRENSTLVWPFLPMAGTDEDVQARYMDEFGGLRLPRVTARPVFLPYILASVGEGASLRAGLDVKVPVTPTLTGVGTLAPDFETVEQAVTDIAFSYTEKYLEDRRPFFAEGSEYLPPYALFFSRRVREVDAGVKLVGRDGAYSVGALGAVRAGDDRLSLGLLQVQRTLGLYGHIGVSGVSADGAQGPESNNVARVFGAWGWRAGGRLLSVSAHSTESWREGRPAGSERFLRVGTDALAGKPSVILDLADIEPDYHSEMGYVPERNIRGYWLRLRQFDKFERGPLTFYEAFLSTDRYERHTGGFFRASTFFGGVVQNQAGWQVFAETGQGRRDGFSPEGPADARYDDRITTLELAWNVRTLLKRGSVLQRFGTQASRPYSLTTVSQGLPLSRPLTASASFSRVKWGDESATQAVLNASYTLDSQSALGGRLVLQDGDSSLFLSYGRQVRAGADVFILYGEPDPLRAAKTRHKLTVKIVRPL